MDSREFPSREIYRACLEAIPVQIAELLAESPRELGHGKRVIGNLVKIKSMDPGEVQEPGAFVQENTSQLIAAFSHDANKAREGYLESNDPEYRIREAAENASFISRIIRETHDGLTAAEVDFLIKYHEHLGIKSSRGLDSLVRKLHQLQMADIGDFFAFKVPIIMNTMGYDGARKVVEEVYQSGSEKSREFARDTLERYGHLLYNGNGELRRLLKDTVLAGGREGAPSPAGYSRETR